MRRSVSGFVTVSVNCIIVAGFARTCVCCLNDRRVIDVTVCCVQCALTVVLLCSVAGICCSPWRSPRAHDGVA